MKSIIEGERALSFWLAQQTEVSLHHKDNKIKEEASDLVSLMTPVVKSLFSDMGMENYQRLLCKFLVDMAIQKTKVLNSCIETIELHQYMKEQIQFRRLIWFLENLLINDKDIIGCYVKLIEEEIKKK